jgi:S-formylglutathione hydrolase FrmB
MASDDIFEAQEHFFMAGSGSRSENPPSSKRKTTRNTITAGQAHFSGVLYTYQRGAERPKAHARRLVDQPRCWYLRETAMAFATINYYSGSLRKASSFNIVFPDDPNFARPWSVFYLLHGLSDDHTIWMRRTSIERYVKGMSLVIVMPDGGRGWYTNALEGLAYEDDLIKDVISLVDLRVSRWPQLGLLGHARSRSHRVPRT